MFVLYEQIDSETFAKVQIAPGAFLWLLLDDDEWYLNSLEIDSHEYEFARDQRVRSGPFTAALGAPL